MPSFTTMSHSSGETGCTDRREFLTSAIFSKPGVALISRSGTMRLNLATALMSTIYHMGLSGVLLGSGCSDAGSQAVWSG